MEQCNVSIYLIRQQHQNASKSGRTYRQELLLEALYPTPHMKYSQQNTSKSDRKQRYWILPPPENIRRFVKMGDVRKYKAVHKVCYGIIKSKA